MRTITVALLLISPALWAQTGADPEGWSHAKWGMKSDEILRVFSGEATKLSGTLGYGIKEVVMGVVPMDARFMFRAETGTLESVHFYSIEESKEDEAQRSRKERDATQSALKAASGPGTKEEKDERARQEFRRLYPAPSRYKRPSSAFDLLEIALTEKYGSPLSRKATYSSKEARWTFPSTIIELSYSDFYGLGLQKQQCLLVYKSSRKESPDRL